MTQILNLRTVDGDTAVIHNSDSILKQTAQTITVRKSYRCGFCTNGYISAFAHVHGGVCFRCGGTGVEYATETLYTEKGYALKLVRDEKKAKKQAEEARLQAIKGQEILNAFLATLPEGVADWFVAETQDKEGQYSFYGDLLWKLKKYGSLSEKQVAAIVKGFEKHQQRLADKAKALESEFVGEVGKRITLKLVTKKQIHFETAYGRMTIEIFADEQGNVLVYKGGNDYGFEELTEVKATIKEHTVREGVKQTFIQRIA